MTKKKILYICLWVAVIWWGSYFFLRKWSDSSLIKNPDRFVAVSTWDLSNSINVVGKTTVVNEQKLKFTQWWTVQSVLVTAWQEVKKWDVLAYLDKSEIENEIKDTEIRLDNSKIQFRKLLDKNVNTDKVKAFNELDNLEYKLKNAQQDLENMIKEQQENVSDKEIQIKDLTKEIENQKLDLQTNKSGVDEDYSLKKKELEDKEKSIKIDEENLSISIDQENKNLNNKISSYYKEIENTYLLLKDDISDADQSLRAMNDLLWVDKDYASSYYNAYFSVKNSSYKTQTEKYYFESKNNMQDLKNYVETLNANSLQIPDLLSWLNIDKKMYNSLYEAWDYGVKWLDNSVESTTFSSSDISNYKSTFNSAKSKAFGKKSSLVDQIVKLQDLESPERLRKNSENEIEKKKQAFEDSKNTLERLRKEIKTMESTLDTKKSQYDIGFSKSQQTLENLKNSYNKLKIDNNIAIANKKSEIKNMTLDYEIAKKDFDKFDDNDEIKISQNWVKQNEISLDQVKKKMENYELRAPFDGVVNKIDLKVWDNLTSTNESSISLINPNLIEVVIKLDQIDVVKIRKWQIANIVFDSFPWTVFTWSLGDIDSKPVEEDWTTKYQLSILLTKGWAEENIFSWMSASVEIVIDKIENVLMLPSMSIEVDEADWKNYVTLHKDGQKIKKYVEVWMVSNWNTEILSGLNIWDEVLEINFDANKFKPEDFNSFWWMY